MFLDGVGLGEDDPACNPLAAGHYPTLAHLLDDHRPVGATGRLSTTHAELIPTDACMGVTGRPQSATGQTAILTGINAPQRLGEHYGPRPDARVRAVLDEGNLFRRLRDAGLRPFFCNAYPDGYFAAVERGKRLLSAVPYAATTGGQALMHPADLEAGQALAADFTSESWREHLGYPNVPVYEPEQAGRQLWKMAAPYQFVFFEHWMTDVLGHRRQLDDAVINFRCFDHFLSGLLSVCDLAHTLIIISSDHGNVEDCSHGKHTENPALTLLLGAHRRQLAAQIHTLTDFVPAILQFFSA